MLNRHVIGALVALFAFGLVACGAEAEPTEVDTSDAAVSPATDVDDAAMGAGDGGAPLDSASDSAAASDSAPAADLGEVGSGVSTDTVAQPTSLETAWGTIEGACGVLTAAAQAPEAALLQTIYTFADPDRFDAASLSGQRQARFEEANAGGSSSCSEVMSMALLVDCEGAVILKRETEVSYDVEGKIADYIATLGPTTAGVSVTRAYLGPVVDTYTLDDATELLEKKLAGIAEARDNVSESDAWDRSVVHVWTLHPSWAQTVQAAWENLDPTLRGSALVLVTVEAGSEYIVTDACDG